MSKITGVVMWEGEYLRNPAIVVSYHGGGALWAYMHGEWCKISSAYSWTKLVPYTPEPMAEEPMAEPTWCCPMCESEDRKIPDPNCKTCKGGGFAGLMEMLGRDFAENLAKEWLNIINRKEETKE